MNLVLERNASIFGSIYKEKKLPKKTLEIMASELVIPENVIEMEYVDGGGFISIIDTRKTGFAHALTAILGLVYVFGALGTIYGKTGSALFLVPEPTLVTKIFGGVMWALGVIAGYIASAAVHSAILAADKKSRNEHFKFGIETVFFGIPIGMTIQ
ncbi:hypothetical protein BN85400870 [Alteracholeplasma palmae J233]|uniref:Uncharacterized protein n=1 Tax=Alteracholeplasma palmae (strain ATCC 49389 / J233) TaxID=1318466 RepID=U4KJK3_ALTPJ|nr:hypothetical protein [Alteracholeplasma palmae]CCV63664.1 hypothetical protein BN85400870 [Alteracholeplasma palmae J233]